MNWMLLLTALHIIAFAAWMAGMWYLPRLLVYHADAKVGSELSETLKVMERRLLKVIMNPAMVITLVVGIALATAGSYWVAGWLHVKLLLVVLMLACHGILAKHVRLAAADQRPWPARNYRIINEVPTVLFIVIVLLAVLQPF